MKKMALSDSQVIAVILEQQRLLSRALKLWYGLTVSEYCLLSALGATERPVRVKTLADFLMLKRGTVLDMLTVLETRRLIEKHSDVDDHRVMQVDLTTEGGRIAIAAPRRLYALQERTFWRDLPEHDLSEVIFCNVHRGVDALRGKPVPQIRAGVAREEVPVELLLCGSAMIDAWESAVRQGSGLAFSEYRILAVLEESGAMASTAISDRLRIEQSNVSVYKRRLIALGFVREVHEDHDGRRVLLQCTKEGAKLVRRLANAVGRVTCLTHEHLPDVEIMTVNAWYARMYRNLVSTRIQDEELRSL